MSQNENENENLNFKQYHDNLDFDNDDELLSLLSSKNVVSFIKKKTRVAKLVSRDICKDQSQFHDKL